MSARTNILSKVSLEFIYKKYELINKRAFVNNLITYLNLFELNSYQSDSGYQYRLYYYNKIFESAFKQQNDFTLNQLSLIFSYHFNKFKAMNGVLNLQLLSDYTLVQLKQLQDACEYIVYTKQIPSINDLIIFPNVFSVINNLNELRINGVLVLENNIKMALYNLMANSIYTQETSLFLNN